MLENLWFSDVFRGYKNVDIGVKRVMHMLKIFKNGLVKMEYLDNLVKEKVERTIRLSRSYDKMITKRKIVYH